MNSDEPTFFSGMSIEAIGKEGNRYIAAVWNRLYMEMYEELTEAFQTIEDGAYGMYLDRLMPLLFEKLEVADYRVIGVVSADDFIIGKCLKFADSVEQAKWGTEDHQARLFWNVVRNERDEPIGTLITELPHSHRTFAIPVAPQLHVLKETERKAIIAGIRRIKQG
jgi:Family of unknown function (DUF6022)